MASFVRDRRLSEFSVEKALKILRLSGVDATEVDEKGYDIVLPDTRKVEVKFDTWIKFTGNVSAEWWSNEAARSKGWAQYSDADIMVYMYDFDNAYVLDMQKTKRYIADNYERLDKKYAYRKLGTALNVMLPIASVPELRLTEFEEMFKKYAILDAAKPLGPDAQSKL